MLISQTVVYHDVADVEAFVQATINKFQAPNRTRGRIELSSDERDELVAEGLAIMAQLAAKFEPHRAGYEQPGRFSGYAAQMLPRKLGDAWHAMHPEHRLVTDDDGRRRWHYGERAMSLDGLISGDGDRQNLLTVHDPTEPELAQTIRRVLDADWIERREVAVQVGLALGAGASLNEAAAELGYTREMVKDAFELIARNAHRFDSQTA